MSHAHKPYMNKKIHSFERLPAFQCIINIVIKEMSSACDVAVFSC